MGKKKVAGTKSPGSTSDAVQGTEFVYCVFFEEDLEELVSVGVSC